MKLYLQYFGLILTFFFLRYVSEKLGGAIERGQVSNFSWELPMSQVKFELKSNVVPIGKVKAGIHIHRALLFKVLHYTVVKC